MHYSDQLIREIVDSGVRGYVLKSDSDQDLLIAVETLARHKPFFTSKATEVIKSEFNTDEPLTKILKWLRNRVTSREREIIQLIAERNRANEITSSFAISSN